MDDHFYLTFSSDGVNELPERIRLSDDYEVGLSEIVYPRTWYNIEEEKYWIGVVEHADVLRSAVSIKPGLYKDNDVFASSLTQQVTRAFAGIPNIDVKFTFLKTIDRMRIQIRNSSDYTVVPSEELLEFLGFGPKLIYQKYIDRTGSKTFDVNRGHNLMFVYCDVASYSIVGDTKTPLLRVVNVSGKHGEIVRTTYDRPHYVPIGRREFGSVKISINNEVGRPISLRSGQFLTTLHFRRRR